MLILYYVPPIYKHWQIKTLDFLIESDSQEKHRNSINTSFTRNPIFDAVNQLLRAVLLFKRSFIWIECKWRETKIESEDTPIITDQHEQHKKISNLNVIRDLTMRYTANLKTNEFIPSCALSLSLSLSDCDKSIGYPSKPQLKQLSSNTWRFQVCRRVI